jgi:hypothetical protein
MRHANLYPCEFMLIHGYKLLHPASLKNGIVAAEELKVRHLHAMKISTT